MVAGGLPSSTATGVALTTDTQEDQERDSFHSSISSMGSNDSQDDSSGIALSEGGIRSILECLSSGDVDVFSKAMETLTSTIDEQPDTVTEQLLNHIPRLLRVTHATKDEERRSSLIELLGRVASLSSEGESKIKEHSADLVTFLKESNTLDKFHILRILEDLLDKDDETFEAQLVALLKDSIYDIPDYDDESRAHNYKQYTNAIETFEHTLVMGQPRCRNVALKADVLSYLVMSTFAPDKKTRLAAVSCMVQAFGVVDDLMEHVPGNDILHLRGLLVIPLLDLINDDDTAVSTAVLDFLYGTEETYEFFWAHDRAVLSLLSRLARRDPLVESGSLCDWMISHLISKNTEMVVDGFRRFWTSNDVESGTKMKLIGVLSNTLSSVRNAAAEGGAIEFVESMVKKEESPDDSLVALSALYQGMQDDILFGRYILKANAIPWLVTAIQTTNADLVCAASSILRRLVQSNHSEDLSALRREVVAIISANDTLPLILSNASSDDKKISDSALHLLSEMLVRNTESDEFPSILRSIITNALVTRAVTNLDTQSSLGALEILARVHLWDTTGARLVQDIFSAHVPTAPISFFASLNPDFIVSGTDWDPRDHIRAVAGRAGALPRVLELLREPTTVESRRDAVRAVRGLLSGADVDRDIGRSNKHLPDIVKLLVEDGSVESLVEASRLMTLLAEPFVPNPFGTWMPALATQETVACLVEHLEDEPGAVGEEGSVKGEGLSGEKHDAAVAAYERGVQARADRSELAVSHTLRLIKNLLPILEPFKSKLAVSLLSRYVTHGQDEILDTVEALSSSAKEADLEPLTEAARQILSRDTLPSLERLNGMIRFSAKLVVSLCSGGVATALVDLAAKTSTAATPLLPNELQEVEVGEEASDAARKDRLIEIVRTFSTLLAHLRVFGAPKTSITDVQRPFFGSPILVRTAVDVIIDVEEGFGTYMSWTMALDLSKLAEEYEPKELVDILMGEGERKDALVEKVAGMFEEGECEAECVAPILGLLVILADIDSTEDKGQPVRDTLGEVVKRCVEEARAYIAANGSGSAVGGKQGKKNRKKSQVEKPRLGTEQLMARLRILAAAPSSSHAIRQLVLEAGGVEVAWDVINEGLSATDRDNKSGEWAVEILRVLLKEEGASPIVLDAAWSKLPTLMSAWTTATAPRAKGKGPTREMVIQAEIVLRFLEVIALHDRSAGPESIVELGWSKVLTAKLCEGGPVELLVRAVVALGLSGKPGRKAVVEDLKAVFESPGAFKSERKLGISSALRRILGEGSGAVGLVIEAGAIEYAVRLLNATDTRLRTIGASLSAALALADGTNTLPILQQEHGIVELVESVKATVDTLLLTLPEKDCKNREEAQGWRDHLEQCLVVVKGEERVADFERWPNF